MKTGPRNLITDVAGLSVGNAHDAALRSGVTVLLPDAPALAAADIRGGGTGTRETHALELEGTVERIHGLALSGGSAFGLDAATGVQAFLRERGIGYAVGDARVPIVPAAILFDLLNGGNKDWGTFPPYRDLAYTACKSAAGEFGLGTAGAGYGATTANLKGGLGSASAVTAEGCTVGALAAVNAVGRVTVADTPHFWAAPFEIGAEFGGRGPAPRLAPEALELPLKGSRPRQATTLVVVATDADISQVALKRIAIMANAGLARAIYPAHSPLDGDIVLALATGQQKCAEAPDTLARLGQAAINVVARAVARGVYEARAPEGAPAGPPAYKELFGET